MVTFVQRQAAPAREQLRELDTLLGALEDMNLHVPAGRVPAALILALRGCGVRALPTDRPPILIERIFARQAPLLGRLASLRFDHLPNRSIAA